MISSQSILFIYLLSLPSFHVLAQTASAYQTSFPFVTSCPITTQYYDTATFQCLPCPANAQQKSNGRFQNIVNEGFFDKNIRL